MIRGLRENCAGLAGADLIKALERAGFRCSRQEGSHVTSATTTGAASPMPMHRTACRHSCPASPPDQPEGTRRGRAAGYGAGRCGRPTAAPRDRSCRL
ncbi:MAG: type II toxin-antitoxin system HicA family toxin [Egibacteraceae bacterium]